MLQSFSVSEADGFLVALLSNWGVFLSSGAQAADEWQKALILN
jgi:hypothetical protein